MCADNHDNQHHADDDPLEQAQPPVTWAMPPIRKAPAGTPIEQMTYCPRCHAPPAALRQLWRRVEEHSTQKRTRSFCGTEYWRSHCRTCCRRYDWRLHHGRERDREWIWVILGDDVPYGPRPPDPSFPGIDAQDAAGTFLRPDTPE
jgi:hypothetical protein